MISLTSCLLLLLVAGPSAVQSRDAVRQLGPSQIASARPVLRWERPAYTNYAIRAYTNYPNLVFPYEDTPWAHYSALGDYLMTGYALYEWSETRLPGKTWGSSIFKHSGQSLQARGPWIPAFDSTVVGRDGYGTWAYSFIVGDGLRTHFSPLTLSKVDLNGARLDLALPHLRLTALGSRIERPKIFTETDGPWASEHQHFAVDSTLLLGGRALAELGGLQLGLNWTNLHVYNSIQPGNSLKGRLRSNLPLTEWIIVRFTDDSPTDGMAGAVLQEVRLVLNGELRPDLPPHVLQHGAGFNTQVGSVSQRTGQFTPIVYNEPAPKPLSTVTASFGKTTRFYRGRSEVPFYADYLYRIDHEAGIDISRDTNVEGLLTHISLVGSGETARADGDGQVVVLFDLSQEPRVESVAVEAVVGGDYRVDIAQLRRKKPSGRYFQQFQSSFYRTVRRARGNVQDLSNLKRLRLDIGEDTALFTYGADATFSMAGLEINAEYARSARYGRYPAQMEGTPIFDESPRFSHRGAAHFVNATRWFGRGRIGGEYFAINPDFTTDMRTYVPWEVSLGQTHLQLMINDTVYWELVQDNDDGDGYPDRRMGNLPTANPDNLDGDADGVALGQDLDNDGFPETNRNADGNPDYEEPFLMYDVEPNRYVYGLDRNNNNEPDRREDDAKEDYPYDHDQRGFHLFGQWDLTPRWSLAVGRYATEQIAGTGRNESTYALLTYERTGLQRLRRIFFENNLRRVQDDIPDEFVVLDETPVRHLHFHPAGRGLWGGNQPEFYLANKPPIFFSSIKDDPLEYRDSFVNETYLETHLHPGSTLNVVQKMRLRFNWQRGGKLWPGIFQRERRLDLLTWVSRADYSYHWGKLRVVPQYKLMLFRVADQEAGQTLREEIRSIPILRLEYPLLSRTALRAGFQGMGPLPYRRADRASSRDDFEQRTAFITLTNRSGYFGYELITIVGATRNKRDFDNRFQRLRNIDGLGFFVRALVGFTEFGRAI